MMAARDQGLDFGISFRKDETTDYTAVIYKLATDYGLRTGGTVNCCAAQL